MRDNKFKKEILQELLPLIQDASIKSKINHTAKHELPLDRRVNVDMKTATCKERTRADYFSFYLQGYYLDDDLLQKYSEKYVPDALPEDPALLFMSNLFVDQLQVANAELIEQMQMICGYWLSGRIDHRKFYLLNGAGSNGKSYFLKFFDLFLKPLHKTAVPKVVMESKNESDASPENNLLRDSRLVTFSEGTGEQRLNDALIKRITGGDRITGRQLFSNNFDEFYSQSKIAILTNKMPKFDADDQAMLDRIMVLPFNARYPQNDACPSIALMTQNQRARYEAAKPLISELSEQNLKTWSPFKNAVFNWMIAGAKKSYHPISGIKQGYSGCKLSQVKKDEYVDSNDYVSLYISENLIVEKNSSILVKDLCEDYRQWIATNGDATKTRLTNKEIQHKLSTKFNFTTKRDKGPLFLLNYRQRTAIDDCADRSSSPVEENDDF